MSEEYVTRLRDARKWFNNDGQCCGQVDCVGICAAPACIFGEALKEFGRAADCIEAQAAEITRLRADLAALQRDASQETSADELVVRLQHLGDWQAADQIEALQKRVALLVSIIMRSFCYDDEEDLLRLLARSLCRIEGQDPDAIVSVDKGPFEKNWKRFLPQARAALKGEKDG